MHRRIFILGSAAALLVPSAGVARDNGQWVQNIDQTAEEKAQNEKIRAWFREPMQPDNPMVSCCGEADAYYADIVYTRDGKNIAVITDTRPDGPLQRPHVPVGTEVVIPDRKYKWNRGNPTGHRVIFLSNPGKEGQRDVYCFVDDTGI